MKESLESRLFRLVTVASLVGTAGCAGVDKVFHPSDIASSPTPITSPLPSDYTPLPDFTPTIPATIAPTLIPTIEATKTATAEPTPSVPENPRFFEGVGDISSIEQRASDGKWYGIDTVGRAEIVYQNGEWVRYDRPVIGTDFQDFNIDETWGEKVTNNIDSLGLDLTDLPASEITMLANPDGLPVNWGYQQGSIVFFGEREPRGPGVVPTDTDSFYGRVSGYFIGAVTSDYTEIKISTGEILLNVPARTYFVFEIPYKYERQILLISESSSDNQIFNVRFGDTYEYKGKADRQMAFSKSQMTEFFSDNLKALKGQQCVIDTGYSPSSIINFNLWSNLFQYKAYDNQWTIELFQNVFFNSKFAGK